MNGGRGEEGKQIAGGRDEQGRKEDLAKANTMHCLLLFKSVQQRSPEFGLDQ